MALMGYYPEYGSEYFSNGVIDIFDAVPNNVLHGIDGNIYFIDTICLPSSADNIITYRKTK